MIQPTASLCEFQDFNKKLYEIVDDRNYDITDLHSYLLRHVTHILKAVRKGRHENTKYHLCMALSWALAIANRFHIDVSHEMWNRFPGVCPYCTFAPCSCKHRAHERKLSAASAQTEAPASLSDYQRMFSTIYPNNSTQDSAMHLAEEVGELSEAIRIYLATHSEDWFNKSVEELVDVIANLFGIATCLGYDLGIESALYFKSGCPKCTQVPCGCGYVSMDNPI